MVWHDCKTDPPKKDGEYILCYDFRGKLDWDRAFYEDEEWMDEDTCIIYSVPVWSYEELVPYKWVPYKWAEVDLLEIE